MDFLSFAKNMVKNIDKNISKNLSGEYSLGVLVMCQRNLDRAKKSAADALKTSSRRVIGKTIEAAGDFIGIKIASRITKFSEKSQQVNSEAVTN